MRKAFAQADESGQFETTSAAFLGDGPLIGQRRLDVLHHGQLRNEIVRLKYEPDAEGANGRELVVVKKRYVIRAEVKLAGGRFIQTTQKVEQRALTGTRRPHDSNVIAFRNFQINPLEHCQRFSRKIVILA